MTKLSYPRECQGELVEPGFMEETRLRQAQADTLIV